MLLDSVMVYAAAGHACRMSSKMLGAPGDQCRAHCWQTRQASFLPSKALAAPHFSNDMAIY